jgi:hypothetical protein
MKPHSDWHFPRPQLAAHYLDAFDVGLVAAKALFAQRRMGKTTFLLEDLAPAAAQRKYRVAYANLWDDRASPRAVILDALNGVQVSLGARLRGALRQPVRKLAIGGKAAGIAEGSASIEWDEAGSKKSFGHQLAELLDRLASKRTRLLLLLDEAQVLALSAENDTAAALRAALDTRKDVVKVIFTGSSETSLRQMFGRERLPFYRWAPVEDFPLLGRDFVQHQVRVFSRLSRHRLPLAVALRIFEELHAVPEYFRLFLDELLRSTDGAAEEALKRTRSKIGTTAQYSGRWERLLPADREVLRLVASDCRDLHSRASRARIGVALGASNAVDLATVGNALRRLTDREGVLRRVDRGLYAFEDEEFLRWIRELGQP